jgi:hypothetical protein
MLTAIFWLSEAGPEAGPSLIEAILWWVVFLVGLAVGLSALFLLIFGWQRFNAKERWQLLMVGLLL